MNIHKTILLLLFLPFASHSQQTVKLFILAGQSNMQGYGQISQLENILCAKEEIDLPQDPNDCYLNIASMEERLFNTISDFYWTGSTYGYGYDAVQAQLEAEEISALDLVNESLLEPFDKIQALSYKYSRDGNGQHNPPSVWEGGLEAGYGVSSNHFGPELVFGRTMAQYIDEDIILLKVAEGGSDLHVKWRSPSMVDRLGAGDIPSNYPLMVQHVNEIINNPGDYISKYAGQDIEVELAGFVWFQGWNDSSEGTGTFADNYELNLIDLINDLRSDLNAPDLPVAIGKTHNDSAEGIMVQEAQEIVSQTLNNVRAVTTNDLSNYFHFDSGSHLIIGDRLGLAMNEVLNYTSAQRKVLIIGIDGCRPDALMAANTPNIDQLLNNGTYSMHAQTQPPTVSGPGWSAMLTGVWHDKHGVYGNSFDNNNYDSYPHFFNRIETYNPDLFTASIVHWSPINSSIVDQADLQIETSDQGVSDEAVALLQDGNPDALFLHFDNVDGAGHGFGYSPNIPEYTAAIEQVDALIGPVIDAINNRPTIDDENWVIILSTDHGGLGSSHGGSSPEEKTIFVIVSGDNVPNEAIVPVSDQAPVSPAAFALNGSDNYASILDNETFNFGATTDFTIECRVKSTGWTSDPAIISDKNWASGNNKGFVIAGQSNETSWKVNIGDGSNRIDLNGGTINDDLWHHLSLTCDRDGNATIFQDGIQVATTSMESIGNIHSPFPIGIGQDGTLDYAAFFNGEIDEIRIWQKALDAATIGAWSCQDVNTTHPDYATLIGYWKIDEGVGIKVYDETGNENDITLNYPSWSIPDSAPSCSNSGGEILEIVDVAYTALEHLCIPINTNWELDGKAVGVNPCNNCCTSNADEYLILHMPRLIGDEDESGIANTVNIDVLNPAPEDHIYTGIKNKTITVDLLNDLSTQDMTLSFKIIPDDISQTQLLLNTGFLDVALTQDGILNNIDGQEVTNPAGISTITCNHIAVVLDNGSFKSYVNGQWLISSEPITASDFSNQILLNNFPGRIFDVRLYEKALTNHQVEQLSQYCLTNLQVDNPPLPDFPDPICAAYVCLWGNDSVDLSEEKFHYYVTRQELAYETWVFEVGMYPHDDLKGFVNGREDRDLGMYPGIVASFVDNWSFSNPHLRENGNYWWHENFHSYQSNCGNPAAKWILESTAEWGPDVIFPGATTTLLGYYTFHPHLPIWTNQSSPVDDYAGWEFKGGHQYGAYVFFSYLTNVITDNRLIGNLFNDSRVNSEPMKVVEELLLAESYDLREVFSDFAAHATVWDYYDGTGPYFEDSEAQSLDRMMSAFPNAGSFDNKFTSIMDENGTAGAWASIPENLVPGAWAYNAYQVNTGTESTNYLIKLKGKDFNPDNALLRARVVIENSAGFTYYDMPINQETVFGAEEASFNVTTESGDILYLVVSTTPDLFTHNFEDHYDYEYSIGQDSSTNIVENAVQKIAIYPTVSNGNYRLDLSNVHENVNLKIFDAAGRMMETHQFKQGNSFDFQIEEASGIYFIWVELADQTFVQKLIKE